MTYNWTGWKKPLNKWHTFWMAPYLICLFFFLFFVILFYIEREWLLMRNVVPILPLKSKLPGKFQRFNVIKREWLLMRNVVPILPLKSKLSGKFQRFNAINRSIKMLKIVEFSKISFKIKNCKTFCKAQTVNRLKKFIQAPPSHPRQIKPYYVSKTNFLRRYIEIYRHLLSNCFNNAVLGRQEMV